MPADEAEIDEIARRQLVVAALPAQRQRLLTVGASAGHYLDAVLPVPDHLWNQLRWILQIHGQEDQNGVARGVPQRVEVGAEGAEVARVENNLHCGICSGEAPEDLYRRVG